MLRHFSCPICGGHPVTEQAVDGHPDMPWIIRCTRCPEMMVRGFHKEDVTATWNAFVAEYKNLTHS